MPTDVPMTVSDVVLRCGDYFLCVLAEGDLDSGHYDKYLHRLLVAAPASFVAKLPRYEGMIGPPAERPEPLAWSADAMVTVVCDYFEVWPPADDVVDSDWHEGLDLAIELSRECSADAAEQLLGLIEGQLLLAVEGVRKADSVTGHERLDEVEAMLEAIEFGDARLAELE